MVWAMNDPSCVFCGIEAGREPAHEVWRDDHVVAFFDRVPLFKGHVLVIPRGHVETLADLDPSNVEPLFQRVRTISRGMQEALGAAGSFVAMNNIVSQSVPHLHVHVVPRNRKDGLKGFFWPRTKYESDDEMAEYAATLNEWLQGAFDD